MLRVGSGAVTLGMGAHVESFATLPGALSDDVAACLKACGNNRWSLRWGKLATSKIWIGDSECTKSKAII